jgi:environmental stress-induced protein Ves
MSRLRQVPTEALKTQAWANGAGTTTEIASGPDTDWQWRLSIADITQACRFSRFPDTRRLFVTLDAPVQLRFGDEPELSLLRLQVTAFDGAEAPTVTLPEGAPRAFNVMLRGDAQGKLIARPLNGSMWLPSNAPWHWLVHVLSGRAEIQVNAERDEFATDANVWIDAQPGERVMISGGGELILVQLAGCIASS